MAFKREYFNLSEPNIYLDTVGRSLFGLDSLNLLSCFVLSILL